MMLSPKSKSAISSMRTGGSRAVDATNRSPGYSQLMAPEALVEIVSLAAK